MGWVVSVTPQPLYPRERYPVPIVQEARCAPGPVWMEAKNLAPHQDFFILLSLYFIRTCSFVWIVLALPLVLYCTTHTTQTPMPQAGFETANPASDRPQTLALDR